MDLIRPETPARAAPLERRAAVERRLALADCTSPDSNQAQVAPDRFVMQSATALQLVNQQFSVVHRRLNERLAAALGQGPGPMAVTTAGLDGWGPYLLASLSPGVGALAQAQTSTDVPATLSLSGQSPGNPALGMFVHVERGRNKVAPTDFDRGFNVNATSFTVGADYLLNPKTLLGISYVHDNARSNLDTSDGGQPGSLELRGNTVLLYGAWYPTPDSWLDATLLYGRNKYSTVRKFDFEISEILDTTTGNTSGTQRGISLGAGFTVPRERWTFGPYARLDYTKIKIDGFTEEGGNKLNEDGTSNNLAVRSQELESLLTRLGGQVAYSVGMGWGVLAPYGFLEWAHQFRDDRSSQLVASKRDVASDATMVIHTTPVDRNYGNLGLGLAAHFGVGRSALLYYQTEFGHSGQRANTLTAELRLEF